MPKVAWPASPRGSSHERGGVAAIWMMDERERPASPGRGLGSRGQPQTLAEQVLRSPRGRWRPPPRIAGPGAHPEASEIDHYGTGKRNTLAGDLGSGRRHHSAFSRSDYGGPDLPKFRNLDTAYTPRAQEFVRQNTGKNPRNVPLGATRVQDIARKYTRPLDPYKVFTKQQELQDTSRKLCFRAEPLNMVTRGQDTLDLIQPGRKCVGLAPRQPPSMN